MRVLFIEYPKCSTCQKAKKWLAEHQVDFEDRHIVENNPTKEELKEWIARSELPMKRFFNTSGNLYKELQMKDKMPVLPEDELLDILASNGMMVKRPLVISDDFILVGFKPEQWEQAFAK